MTRLTQSLLMLARVEAEGRARPRAGRRRHARGRRRRPTRSSRTRGSGDALDEIEPDLVAEGDPVLAPAGDDRAAHATRARTPRRPARLPFAPRAGRGQDVTIEVQDTGKGIPPEEQDRVFERFYRGSATLEGEGFGLGLSIARRMVNVMGGEIGLRSEPGTGEHLLGAPARRQTDPHPGRMSPAPPATSRILVVDDELSVRESVGYALEQEGFDVTLAANGEEAEGQISDDHFDLLILDIMMPGQERPRPLPRGPRAQPRPDHPADRQGRRGRQGRRPRGRRRRLRHQAVLGPRAARPRAGAAAPPRARPLGRHRGNRDRGRARYRSTWPATSSPFGASRST